MSKKIDKEAIEHNIREILIALGDNPDREGLMDTPKRVANMYEEVFEGMNYSNKEIAEMFDKTFEDDCIYKSYNNMILVEDIPINSYCEHHMALMYNMKVSVVYIPQNKIIGLSKIARVADMVSKRLQLQERIGSDIVNIISMIIGSEDIGVIISGEHSCMTARGIKKYGTLTKTVTFFGKFNEDYELKREALLLLRGH
jgi:GTP cyclohydrolase IA